MHSTRKTKRSKILLISDMKFMVNRVVITGLGVVAPNGVGVDDFKKAIQNGKSGVKFIDELKDLGLNCLVAGIPELTKDNLSNSLPSSLITKIEASNLLFGMIAGVEAWKNSGLSVNDQTDWDSGVIMGSQTIDGNLAKNLLHKVYGNNIRKLSGRTAEQAITSSVSSYLSGYLGLGNCSVSNSAACATGTESIYMGYCKVRNGEAKRILAGSSESNSPFIWSTLDRIRALNFTSNDNPEGASKPMSAQAAGFVPGCGSGALVLENLDSAIKRGATIYAEIVGGANNCGGQRNGGSMTKPNSEGMTRCIQAALDQAKINPEQIDLISGHLTATYADPLEVKVWSEVLKRNKLNFPYISSLKSMTGHCLAATGSIESVAAVLQLHHNFIHPTINCDVVHPEILKFLTDDKIPRELINKEINYIAKASFGFGDLNTCLIFKKHKNE